MIDAETIVAEKLVDTTIVMTRFICTIRGDERPGDRHQRPRPQRACPANTPHGEAWGALARTHAAVSQRLQEALAQGDFPPLPWYEVLAAVAEAPEQRMRMGDLAEALVITRGGLTKLVDRLVKAGPAGADLLRDRSPRQLRDAAAGRRRPCWGDAAGDRRRARDRLLGQPQRRAGRTSCARRSTASAPTPAAAPERRLGTQASAAAARSLADSMIASTPAPGRRAAARSGRGRR